MKGLIGAAALNILLTANVHASLVALDPTSEGGSETEFHFIDFKTSSPISYYIDSTGAGGVADGYVSSGEFVFDFGLDIDASELGFYSPSLVITDLPTSDYGLVADYLLVGEAVVLNDGELWLNNEASKSNMTVAEYVSFVYTNTDSCKPPVNLFFETACSNIEKSFNADGLYDLNQDETLAANITDGLFNLFLTDEVGDRVGLAASFLVTGVDISAESVSSDVDLSIFGEAIQASGDILSDRYGYSFESIIGDPNRINPTIEVSATLVADPTYSTPGSLTSRKVEETNPADSGFFYYTGGNYTVWDITRQANSCGSAPGGTPFGGCSSLIGSPSPAKTEWNRLKGLIRDAAGCEDKDTCDFDVLARTTTSSAKATIYVSAPGALFLTGLALMTLGLRRKFS